MARPIPSVVGKQYAKARADFYLGKLQWHREVARLEKAMDDGNKPLITAIKRDLPRKAAVLKDIKHDIEKHLTRLLALHRKSVEAVEGTYRSMLNKAIAALSGATDAMMVERRKAYEALLNPSTPELQDLTSPRMPENSKRVLSEVARPMAQQGKELVLPMSGA